VAIGLGCVIGKNLKGSQWAADVEQAVNASLLEWPGVVVS